MAIGHVHIEIGTAHARYHEIAYVCMDEILKYNSMFGFRIPMSQNHYATFREVY